MLDLSTRRAQDESGFTLIELLVVILIIGILAAIAIPALLGQKSKAYDSSAKTLAQTAQTAAETYSTENNGLYTFTEAKQLHAIVATGIEGNAGYEVTATAQNTADKYTVRRLATGVVEHKCASSASVKGCPGHSESSTSW